jgi:hypothetical protein
MRARARACLCVYVRVCEGGSMLVSVCLPTCLSLSHLANTTGGVNYKYTCTNIVHMNSYDKAHDIDSDTSA